MPFIGQEEEMLLAFWGRCCKVKGVGEISTAFMHLH